MAAWINMPGSESARERFGQGANRPGTYWPIRSGERIGPGAKRLGTVDALEPSTMKYVKLLPAFVIKSQYFQARDEKDDIHEVRMAIIWLLIRISMPMRAHCA